jgi:hypothetical protein
MKLFTKEIDSKLFEQYQKGSDLENQKVVAKIFNPYGRGTWYLLNSDPQDPDYIWAIVDFFEVEMGSVSRSELQGIKVPPFGLGLERDMSFTPINAKELFEGLLNGEHYKDGGIMLDKDFTAIEKEYEENEDNNYHSENVVLLAENFGTEEEKAEAKEILEKHNEEGSLSSELYKRRSVLEEKLWDKYQALKKIYANGGQTTLFGDGGNVDEQNKEMLKNQAKEFMHHSKELNSLVDKTKQVDAWVVAKAERASTDLSDITHYLEGRMAKGGMMAKGGKMNDEEGIDLFEDYNDQPKDVQKIIDAHEQDFEDGDYKKLEKILKKLNKIGYTFEYGLDGGAYDLRPIGTKGKSEFNNDFDFAKGGELVPYIVWTSKDGNKRELFGEFKSKRSAEIQANKLWETGEYVELGFKSKSSYDKQGLWEKGGMMAKGGMLKAILVHKEFGVEYYKNGSLIKPTKEEKLNWELYGLPNDIEKLEQSFETTIDEFVGKTKKEIQTKSDENIRIGKYDYLGTNPNLHLIFNDKMAKGGYVSVSEKDDYWYIMSKPTTKEKAQELVDMGVPRGEVGKVVTIAEAKAHKKVIGKEYLASGGKMEMGGATFKDKVNTISKRLEGTKVPTRLKKDYGATYDKKEAKQAGQRIAGSMIQKLKMKMKNK